MGAAEQERPSLPGGDDGYLEALGHQHRTARLVVRAAGHTSRSSQTLVGSC